MSDDPVTRSGSGETTVAVACQGGGTHTSFTAGVLRGLFAAWPEETELVALSGTSGGAVCATLAWYGLLDEGPCAAREALAGFWATMAADDPVDATTNASVVWGSRLQNGWVPLPAFSPYQVPFTRWGHRRLVEAVEEHVAFTRVPTLAADHPLRLLVGTVDVSDGRFEVLSDGDVTREALLASTAVPELFEAVELDGHWHWDGLFSQNPPIHDLLSVPAHRKPDEIWVVQINPQARESLPTTLLEIADRRNELAGNLSLNQELQFIDQVNGWIEAGHLDGPRFKRVSVERIQLDRELYYSSKLDRSLSFLRELLEAGEAAAEAFLADRADRTD